MRQQRYRMGVIPDEGGYDPIDPIPEEETGTGGGTGEPPPIDNGGEIPGDSNSKTIMLLVAAGIAIFLMTNKSR